MKISLVINTDTRPVCNQFEGMWKGVRSRDFLTHGVRNKKAFFNGFDIETIVHCDEHEPLTPEQYEELHSLCDCLVIRKHSKYYRGANPFNAFNDISYIQALSMSRGTHVVHVDQDMAMFTADGSIVEWMAYEIDNGPWRAVSYPSVNSPAPAHAPEYGNKWWCSTRFFMVKREELDFTTLERAVMQNDWFYNAFDRPPRINPWLEQFLGVMLGYKVLYPSPDVDRWCVFPWMTYRDGLLEKMGNLPYSEIAAAIHRCGGAGAFYDGVSHELLGI